MAYQKLSEKSLSRALATLGFVLWVIAVIWHGLLGNPSMMGYMYPWFSYTNPVHAIGLLAVFAASGYVIGFLAAKFYNKNLKRK